MKMKYIFMISAMLLSIVCACNRRPENVPDAQLTTGYNVSGQAVDGENNPGEPNARTNTEQMENRQMADQPKVKWIYYFKEQKDADAMAAFDRAEKLVANLRHYPGKLEDSSNHFGQWYILRYPDPPMPELMPTDTPAPDADTFIVDLASQKVVGRMDWETAGPLYLAIVANEDPEQRALLVSDRRIANTKIDSLSLERLASLTSLVAFGHERYVKADDKNSGPQVRKTDEGTIVFEYDVHRPIPFEGYIHCILTIADQGVKFESTETK